MQIEFSSKKVSRLLAHFSRHHLFYTIVILSGISITFFIHYLQNGLALSYNDARSHLDISRRVVEGLKPGLAQLGSVWLPLNHILMIPLVWNDWLWHSGLAGAIWNMLSYVGTGIVIYKYLEKIGVQVLGRLVAVMIFATNVNILYLQSTAMTELLLLFTLTAGSYYLLVWHRSGAILDLIKSSFWIMLATLVRYDGWFLLGFAGLLVVRQVYVRSRKEGYSTKDSVTKLEGNFVLFSSLAAVGVVGWFAWNQVIFKDMLYFVLGPFSAHAQQLVMEAAGVLPTKYNFLYSISIYFYALLYNTYTYPAVLGLIGVVLLFFDRRYTSATKWGTTALLSPLIFNIIALFLGFSVLYIQGISGNTWFNVRYGVMLIPSIAIFAGYLVDRAKYLRPILIASLVFVMLISLGQRDAVTIDDAEVGSSQKNVSEVAGYLAANAKDTPGFVLVSAASHDAIIFSSGLPMKKFIHEGTGKYWENALLYPDLWARWIVMRTYDVNDLTWKNVSTTEGFSHYHLVEAYPFADVYELDEEFIPNLNTQAIIKDNR